MPRSSTPASSRSAAAPRCTHDRDSPTSRGVKVQVPVQPVRLLGHDRHLARQRQDAEGPRRQGARRRALHHELPDVRILREAGRASTLQVQGGQHGAAGPRSATRSPTAPMRSRSGSRPTRLMLAKKPGIRTLDLSIAKAWKDFAGGGTHSLSRRRRACRMGRCQSRTRCRSSTPSTRRRWSGCRRTRTRPRRCSPRARRPRS